MTDSADPAAWLAIARTDREMAAMAIGRGFGGQASFHVQQTIEKALKALLLVRAIEPPRTHDLGYLIDLCRPDMPLDIETLDQISSWAVISRYPTDEDLSPGPEEIARALTIADELLALVQRLAEG